MAYIINNAFPICTKKNTILDDADKNSILTKFDIQRKDIHVIFMLPDRPNLALFYDEWLGGWAEDVVTDEVIANNLGWLTDILSNPNAPKTLLFVPCHRSMTTIHSWLFMWMLEHNMEPDQQLDQVCGSSSASHKAKTLERFCVGSLKVVVCTSVWAAGIDFPNVQLVVTFWAGKNQTLRDDWQEGGRAGR